MKKFNTKEKMCINKGLKFSSIQNYSFNDFEEVNNTS